MAELKLTPQAEADLEEIWRYTAGEWSPAQADRYIDALTETFSTLCEMPGLARERREFTPPVRIHPSGSHVAIYRIEGEVLLVIRVLGGKQDWAAAVRALEG